MENKIKPLDLVERYHKRYVEYETAFNKDPFDNSKIAENLKKVIDSGVSFDSQEFEEAVIDLIIEKPARTADVNNAALRFLLYTEFYLATQEENLPENIQKDFENLPLLDTLKPYYSIKDEKFVRNEDIPIKIERDKLKSLYQALKNQ